MVSTGLEYPIHRFRKVEPEWTLCETCDRRVKSKDWRGHAAGKKHREAKKLLEAKVKEELGISNEQNTVARNEFGKPANDACRNCGQSGHFARECSEPKKIRQGGDGCFNCGQNGHLSRDCTEPRKPREGRPGRSCHNCGQEGHLSRECPEPRVQRCRNCDAEGHMSKECPEPKDWSRVKCSNCDQMGHGQKRCPLPLKEDESAGGLDEPTNLTPPTAVEGSWNDATTSMETAFASCSFEEANGVPAEMKTWNTNGDSQAW